MSGSGEGNSVHFYVNNIHGAEALKKHHEGKTSGNASNNDFGFVVPQFHQILVTARQLLTHQVMGNLA